MDSDIFYELVEEAMQEIPDYFRERLDNISVDVVPLAPPELARDMKKNPWQLLGVYQGVPYTKRNQWYANVMPDRILIFQKPIESLCRTRAGIRRLVRRVVIHEVGHYFGLSDAELHKLEAEGDAAARKKRGGGNAPPPESPCED
jgi:predicted Zn-dependent protease with MMP-like domain